jgi:hypothetical protein
MTKSSIDAGAHRAGMAGTGPAMTRTGRSSPVMTAQMGSPSRWREPSGLEDAFAGRKSGERPKARGVVLSDI